MNEGEDIRVQLARMEGKVDLTNTNLANLSALHDERHEAIKGHLSVIDSRLHTHGNRIGVLEAARHLTEGEKKGIQLTGKMAWTLAAFLVGLAVSVAGLAIRLL